MFHFVLLPFIKNRICQLASNYDELDVLVSDMKGWSCQMEFNLSSSPNDDPNYIDLCTVLKGGKPFQLPQHFHGENSRKKLITDLKISAMKSGFALIHRSSKSKKQLDKGDQLMSAYLTLQCQHGLTYNGTEKSYDHVFKTKWCRKNDVKCNFRINISLQKETNRWWIHNTKGRNRNTANHHVGHFKMDASHIHTNISLLPKAEITMAKHCSQLNMTCSNMAALVNIRNVLGVENNWTRHQLYYQNRLSENLRSLNSNASNAEKASSAEKLIRMFEERSDTNFMYLTYNPTEGLVLMKGKKKFLYYSSFLYILVQTFN